MLNEEIKREEASDEFNNPVNDADEETKNDPTVITPPRPKITMPEQISDFWRRPIEHPIEDLCFEIYYIDEETRHWKPVDFPIDPKTGRILPPFTEEEILSFGYGPGKYIFRPKSIRTGKLLKGSETHVLGRKERELPKEIQREPEPRREDVVEKMYNMMINMMQRQLDTMQNMILQLTNNMAKIQEKINQQPQPVPQSSQTDISTVLASFMSVLKEVEKGKTALETKKIEFEKDIELKKLEFQHRLNELKAKLGEIPHDEKYEELRRLLGDLEEKVLGKKEEKKSGWKETLEAIINGATEFIKSLTPLISLATMAQGSSQTGYSPFGKKNSMTPPIEEELDESTYREVEEEVQRLEEEMPSVVEEISDVDEQNKQEVQDEGKNTDNGEKQMENNSGG